MAVLLTFINKIELQEISTINECYKIIEANNFTNSGIINL